MYRIRKSFTFHAAHQLNGLPDGHQCARLHGHTYTIDVTVRADQVAEPGWITDFANLAFVKEFLDTRCDHRFLNDEFPDINPTAENLAARLFRLFEGTVAHLGGELESVRVHETPTAWAEYHR